MGMYVKNIFVLLLKAVDKIKLYDKLNLRSINELYYTKNNS